MTTLHAPASHRPSRADVDAVGRLFRNEQAQLMRLALQRTGHVADAADVVQDAFVAATLSIGNLRDAAAAPTWLRRITVNRCRDLHRHRNRHRTDSLDEIAERTGIDVEQLAVDPASLVADDDQLADSDRIAVQHAVRRAVARLPVRLRSAARLRFVDGLEIHAIGRQLRIPLSTVKTRLHRARARLRGSLRPLAEAAGFEDPRPDPRPC